MGFNIIRPKISEVRKEPGLLTVLTGGTSPPATLELMLKELKSVGIEPVKTKIEGFGIEVTVSGKDIPKFEKHWKSVGGGEIETAEVATATAPLKTPPRPPSQTGGKSR